jgi:hypothetical protein
MGIWNVDASQALLAVACRRHNTQVWAVSVCPKRAQIHDEHVSLMTQELSKYWFPSLLRAEQTSKGQQCGQKRHNRAHKLLKRYASSVSSVFQTIPIPHPFFLALSVELTVSIGKHADSQRYQAILTSERGILTKFNNKKRRKLLQYRTRSLS